MQVPRKQHRKRRFSGGSENSCVRRRAEHKDHIWSYDFLTDRTEDGRQLRLLAVIDEYTRECLAIEVGRSFTAQDVIGVLSTCLRSAAHRSTFAVTTAQNSWPKPFAAGSKRPP
jgi:hypothetical protein